MPALVVYLDSNDYSRFAELAKQSDAIRNTWDSLVRWVDEGQIVVRYSSVNVLEAAPLHAQAIPFAQARLSTIQRLCGTHCLVDVFRRLRSEAVDGPKLKVDSDAGDWHPLVHDLRIPGAATIAREMLEKAKSATTSKEYKRLEAEYFDKSGRLRDSARPKIVAFRKSIGAVEFMQYPLSNEALASYFSFLLGRLTRQQFTDALVASFADLKRWGEWYDAAWPVANGLTQTLRAPAEQLAEEVRGLSRMLRVLYVGLQESGYTAKELQQRFDEKANPDAMRNKLIARVTNDGDPRRRRETFSWSTTPAFEIYSAVAMQVVRDSALRVTLPRQPLDSDFVDCLHVCYAPFVDLFRADAYMVGVLTRSKNPLQTRFVSKLEELPDAIRGHPNFSRIS